MCDYRLPYGWVRRISKSTGHEYFMNVFTNESQWFPPQFVIPPQQSLASPYANHLSSVQTPLPHPTPSQHFVFPPMPPASHFHRVLSHPPPSPSTVSLSSTAPVLSRTSFPSIVSLPPGTQPSHTVPSPSTVAPPHSLFVIPPPPPPPPPEIPPPPLPPLPSEDGLAAVKNNGAIRCSHLLVKHKNSRTPVSYNDVAIVRNEDEALSLILSYRNRVIEGKESFAQLASTYSDCSSARRDGDLGPFTRGNMQLKFEEIAFSLKVGELSTPVYTDSGIHLILRTA